MVNELSRARKKITRTKCIKLVVVDLNLKRPNAFEFHISLCLTAAPNYRFW